MSGNHSLLAPVSEIHSEQVQTRFYSNVQLPDHVPVIPEQPSLKMGRSEIAKLFNFGSSQTVYIHSEKNSDHEILFTITNPDRNSEDYFRFFFSLRKYGPKNALLAVSHNRILPRSVKNFSLSKQHLTQSEIDLIDSGNADKKIILKMSPSFIFIRYALIPLLREKGFEKFVMEPLEDLSFCEALGMKYVGNDKCVMNIFEPEVNPFPFEYAPPIPNLTVDTQLVYEDSAIVSLAKQAGKLLLTSAQSLVPRRLFKLAA